MSPPLWYKESPWYWLASRCYGPFLECSPRMPLLPWLWPEAQSPCITLASLSPWISKRRFLLLRMIHTSVRAVDKTPDMNKGIECLVRMSLVLVAYPTAWRSSVVKSLTAVSPSLPADVQVEVWNYVVGVIWHVFAAHKLICKEAFVEVRW